MKFHDFSWLLSGSPRSREPTQLMVIPFVQGPHSNSQNAGSSIQESQYNIKHAGIKEYENTRMQNERNRGHWIQDGGNASQPGGPSKEGPADYVVSFVFVVYVESSGGPLRIVLGAAGASKDNLVGGLLMFK